MAAKVKPVPDGFHTLTPYLVVDGAEKLIAFMKNALGAQFDHEPTRQRTRCFTFMSPMSMPPIRRR
jgi:hypothetical protein